MEARRLPFEPLWRFCRLAHDMPEWEPYMQDEGFTARRCAEMLDRSVDWVRQYRVRGLTVWQADAAACRVNAHPLLIWGADWVEAVVFDELDRTAVRHLRRVS